MTLLLQLQMSQLRNMTGKENIRLHVDVDLTLSSSCFYPVPDSKFNLEAYLGTWYQVAGTPFGPTAGASCVTANYQLNVRESS